ncbi:MAG TPA: carboxypeptidase-like regulatory domain-containing protein [Paludibaculum sp.]|jgi:hypothetical protein
MSSAIAWWLVVFCSTLSLRAGQQDGGHKPTNQFEITGKVVESGFNRGIEGVEVVLERYEGDASSSLTPRAKQAETETDRAGVFRFSIAESGSYRVRVQKEGWRPGGSGLEGFATAVTVTLDKSHPSKELSFTLARPALLTGIVVDKDTQEPIRSLRVFAHNHIYLRGKAAQGFSEVAVTDAQGRFVVSGLPPGDYVIALGPRMQSAVELERNPELRAFGQDRLLTKFADGDMVTTDLDYDWTFWPGGVKWDQAFPINAPSGAKVDVGTLEVRKTTMYRARVDMPDATCKPNDLLGVHIRNQPNPGAGTSLGQVPCGASFIMRGLPPGSYGLEVGGAGGRATAEMTIAKANIALSVPLERGVTIEGKVTALGSTPLDLTQIRLLLKTVDWVVLNAPVTVDAGGHFRLERVTLRDYQLLDQGIPPSHYLRSIHYNGTRLEGNRLSLNSYALAHKLELVVDDQPASVGGTVRAGTKQVSRPWVVLSRWPVGNDVFSGAMSIAGDDEGRFSFLGLAPGEYRMVAVSMEAKRELERPNVLEQLLRSAPKLTLAERQAQSIELKLSTPVRF